MASSGAQAVGSLVGRQVDLASATYQSAHQTVAAGGNAAIATSLPAVAGQFTYITSLLVQVGLAAAGGSVLLTVTGVVGGTLTVELDWTTTGGTLFQLQPTQPWRSTAVNTAIFANVPATGATGPSAMAYLTGFTV